MEVRFFANKSLNENLLEIAVIFSLYYGKLVFVKNKGCNGWEMPGGHREKGEDINFTASRELREETGATIFLIKPLCDYSVSILGHIGYGRLYFANIFERKEINDSEVEELKLFTEVPDKLMYAEVQSALLKKALSLAKSKCLK